MKWVIRTPVFVADSGVLGAALGRGGARRAVYFYLWSFVAIRFRISE
jgi:hypothetical protein